MFDSFKGVRIRIAKFFTNKPEMVDVGKMVVRVTFDFGTFDFEVIGYQIGRTDDMHIFVDASDRADEFIEGKRPIDIGRAVNMGPITTEGWKGKHVPRSRVKLYEKCKRVEHMAEVD